MRTRILIALLALFACEFNAQAGRTGQAKSAEVLARRQKASPRGGKEWGGTSMAFIRGQRAGSNRHTQHAGQFGLPMSRRDRLIERVPEVVRFGGERFRA